MSCSRQLSVVVSTVVALRGPWCRWASGKGMMLTRSLRTGLLLGLVVACTPLAPPDGPGAAGAQVPADGQARPVELDAYGVGMLFHPHPSGSSWSLGTQDPNRADGLYFDMEWDWATQRTESGLTFWSTAGHRITYESGRPDGRTVRLHLRPSGGTQSLSWRDGAASRGYIGNPADLRNFEATVYVRVHEHLGTLTTMSWKLRGGAHTMHKLASSSCVGMEVPYGGFAPQAFRELDHPTYDHVRLTPKFDYQLEAGRWLGVKVVSYLVEGGTRNLLFLDTEPFDASGTPRNAFRLFTEWMDVDGVSTGHYSQAATWAGWETTFRVDGWRQVDFTLLSAREIVPPMF